MKTSIVRIIALFIVLSISTFTLQARESSGNLSVQLGVGIPTGDFGDAAGVGFGGLATYSYNVASMIDITGSVGYFTFGPKEKLAEGFDYSFSTIPIVVGGRYRFSEGNIAPYGGLELGLHLLSSKVTVDLGSFGGKQTASTSETDFGLAPLLGARFNLGGSNMAIDANLKYNIITTSGSSTTFIGINAGIVFPL